MKKAFIAIAIILALLPWHQVRAARQFNGTNQALSASMDLSAVSKVTIVFWLYWDAFANDDDLAFEFTPNFNTNTGSILIDPNESLTGKFQVAAKGNNMSLVTTAEFTRPSAATWHHYAFLIDFTLSTNEITACYVDGSSQSLTRTVNNDNTGPFANSTLYFMSRNAASLFGAGRMAEVAFYPGVLLDAGEITSLAKGASPRMVRTTAKPYYWPLIGRTSPELELFFGSTATVTGASQVDHPAIFLPR